MASVLTFWRLPEEEPKFLDYLDKTGEIVACIYKPFSDPTQIEVSPIREIITADNPRKVLIGTREFMDMTPVTSTVLKGVTTYGRYYGRGPVICYSRPIWRDPGQLARSNLCFDTVRGLPDDSSPDPFKCIWQPQPPEFLP